MMVMVALLQMPWFGTEVGSLNLVPPPYVSLWIMPLFLVPLVFLDSTWCTLYPLPITREDVAVWLHSVNILLEFSSFLASMYWPQGDTDLGKFGISYFELLMMFEIYVGHRLHAEKAVRPHLRPRRPLVFSGFRLV